MPSRKSDPARKSDAATSAAIFAPIEDDSPTPSHPASAPTPSPALALPAMDTSMPPPSLPPPGTAQTPVEPTPATPRPASSSAAAVPFAGAAPTQSTPSEKGKDKEEKSGPGGHPKEAITVPIEELQLPKSIITRLAKGVLPSNTQIQANAILAMTKSATVFINHLANAANEVTALGGKKTIMPADVFRALDDIEFGFMRERVEAEFSKFNETQTTKRSAYRKKVAAAKKTDKSPGEGGADTSMAETDGDTTMAGGDITINSAADSTSQPRAKKARTDGSGEGDSQMDVDDEINDASDPEDVPDEEEDEEEAQEEEEEDNEDGDDDQEEQDELEEREDKPDDDEALDDGNNSD